MKQQKPKSLAEQGQELYEALVILRDEALSPLVRALDWMLKLLHIIPR